MSNHKTDYTKHRSCISTAILDQDTNNISKEVPTKDWWNQFILPSPSQTRMSSSPVLNHNTEVLCTRQVLQDLDSLLTSDSKLDNSRDIKGHLSAEIAKDNVLEMTSESEKETDIKKKKAPLKLLDRKSTDNRFFSVLKSPEQSTSLDEVHMSHRSYSRSRRSLRALRLKNVSSTKISPQKLQEEKEDSEDSMLNTIPLKPRSQFLGDKTKKLRHTLNTSTITKETIEEFKCIEDKNLYKRYMDDTNLSIYINESLSKAKEDSRHDKQTSQYLSHGMNYIKKRHPTLKSQVLHKDKETNAFEDAFANNSDASLSRSKELTKEIDTHGVEARAPKISLPFSSQITVDSSKSNVAENHPNTTSPRSKFFKALKQSSKETRDKIRQDMSANLSDVHDALNEKSVVFKPKTIMMRRALDGSSENPFEKLFQEHSSEGSDTSIRNRASSELDVTAETASLTKSSYLMKNSRMDRSKTLKKWHSSDIPHKRLSSIDNEQDGNISNEMHLEKQHTEVSNAADTLRPSRENRTVLSEKPSSLKEISVLMEEVSEISTDNAPINKTLAGRGTNESGLLKTVINSNLFNETSDQNIVTKRTAEFLSLTEKDVQKKVHLTHSTSRSKSPKIASDVSAKLLRRSTRLNNDIGHSNNLILESEIKTRTARRTRSFTKNSDNSQVDKRASTLIDNSTELEEALATDQTKYAISASRTSQQNSSSSDQMDNKIISRQSSARLSAVQNAGESNVKENNNTSLRQSNSTRSQSQRSSFVKELSKKISKTNALNKTREDFFKEKCSSPSKKHTTSNNPYSVPSEIFKDAKKMQKIKEKVETMKNREIAAMKMHSDKTDKKQLALNVKVSDVSSKRAVKKKKLSTLPAKKVDPAYLVNGKVYKAPRLLRPKQWATDRLYKFLWKRMEPKYKLSMRVRSEKFIRELSEVVTLITRRKKYNSYKTELEALMKEMARLEIINTRNDFYKFCQNFMPYEFRVKAIPILLPGNQCTIPYDPEKLHIPLLDE